MYWLRLVFSKVTIALLYIICVKLKLNMCCWSSFSFILQDIFLFYLLCGWFPRKMMSEKQQQKFHTDDGSLSKSGTSASDWLKICFIQSEALLRSGQWCFIRLHGCGHFSDVIWWGNHNCGIAKCQLFSQDIIDLEQEINGKSLLVQVSEGSRYRESTDSNLTLPVRPIWSKGKAFGQYWSDTYYSQVLLLKCSRVAWFTDCQCLQGWPYMKLA